MLSDKIKINDALGTLIFQAETGAKVTFSEWALESFTETSPPGKWMRVAEAGEHTTTIQVRNVPARIVCLCGSTRFYEQFQKANFDETMAGRIVLSVGFYPHGGFESRALHGGDVGVTPGQKADLDVLHKQKIDLADEVLVLNVDGYIGDSTRSEVLHAMQTGKPVRWLEPDLAWSPGV